MWLTALINRNRWRPDGRYDPLAGWRGGFAFPNGRGLQNR